MNKEMMNENHEKELNEAYRKYQLLWCLQHGYSLEQIIKTAVWIANDLIDIEWIEADEVVDAFNEMGFKGELFACKDEFEDCEFADTEYRKVLESL